MKYDWTKLEIAIADWELCYREGVRRLHHEDAASKLLDEFIMQQEERDRVQGLKDLAGNQWEMLEALDKAWHPGIRTLMDRFTSIIWPKRPVRFSTWLRVAGPRHSIIEWTFAYTLPVIPNIRRGNYTIELHVNSECQPERSAIGCDQPRFKIHAGPSLEDLQRALLWAVEQGEIRGRPAIEEQTNAFKLRENEVLHSQKKP